MQNFTTYILYISSFIFYDIVCTVAEVPLTYTRWGAGEPSNSDGEEDFIEINKENYQEEYRMNDVNGDMLFGFICEKDSEPVEFK